MWGSSKQGRSMDRGRKYVLMGTSIMGSGRMGSPTAWGEFGGRMGSSTKGNC